TSPLYTRIGRLIERLHLTETPQLLHVLTGQLSLGGNRPLPEDVIQSLVQEHPDAEGRFAVRSGMTGPVQLIGRTNISDADRLSIEQEYCRVAASNYSLQLDLYILGMTVPVALGILRARTVDEVREMLRSHAPEIDSGRDRVRSSG
ncbi:MAG: sugar transferase, partial [Planctomycetota bacterium]